MSCNKFDEVDRLIVAFLILFFFFIVLNTSQLKHVSIVNSLNACKSLALALAGK